MVSFLRNGFNWLKTLIRIQLFLVEIVIVCCTWIEFIPLWEFNRWILVNLFGMWGLLIEKWIICCTWVKRLIIWCILHIFYLDLFLIHSLRSKFSRVLRSSIKWYIFFLIFHSWHYFFSHLWFRTMIVFSICRVYIIIRSILRRFYNNKPYTLRRWFFPCIYRMFNKLILIRCNFCMRNVQLY